uniref:Uncharacterized protein n=1 Tax=viral metagenome TaxID=1070528 RepID=A0A6C0JBM7_9ZZZZ|tara:strand:+ start:290 stop:865 length:576 start_codon:yes stop_codon:yes gene_type:complete
MATAIASLPNEVPQNNVVMNVNETNKNVPIPQQESISSSQKELSQESIHQIVQGLQQAGGATVLPNREIPTNNNHITQDEQIKPNFIPKEENTNYIEEEHSMEDLIKQSQNKKVDQDRLDIMYEELQTPLMVMILFFFFQLPIFQRTLTKYVPSLFLRDGNPSFSGYFIKTIIFGVTYYIITKVTKQLSEI